MSNIHPIFDDILNRFAAPLASERVGAYHNHLIQEESRQERKLELIRGFISLYWSRNNQLPDLDLIQETFWQYDLDDDVIKKELEEF